MNDARLELRIRNNVLWHAIFDVHASVAEFCRAYNFDQVNVGAFLNLTRSPYRRAKPDELTPCAARLSDHFGLGASELFPQALYRGTFSPKMIAEVPAERFIALAAARRVPVLPSGETTQFEDERREAIAAVLSTLKPREERMVRLYFGLDGEEEHNLRQIADQFQVTCERVRQIIAKAGVKLRHRSRARLLKPFLHEEHRTS